MFFPVFPTNEAPFSFEKGQKKGNLIGWQPLSSHLPYTTKGLSIEWHSGLKINIIKLI